MSIIEWNADTGGYIATVIEGLGINKDDYDLVTNDEFDEIPFGHIRMQIITLNGKADADSLMIMFIHESKITFIIPSGDKFIGEDGEDGGSIPSFSNKDLH